MSNIRVNYTNYDNVRTSTTINFQIANTLYRESNWAEFENTILGDREIHIQAVKKTVQDFINNGHWDGEDEKAEVWADKEMIESALIYEIVQVVKRETIKLSLNQR